MGTVKINRSALRAATMGPLTREVTRIAQAAQREATSIAKSELGTYDSTRTPGRGKGSIGYYRGGFRVRAGKLNTATRVHRQMFNLSPITNIIEKGSRAHTISPVNSPNLAWTWLDGSQFVGYEGESVSHPGTDAHNIMQRAAGSAR